MSMAEKNLKPIKKPAEDLRASIGDTQPQPPAQPAKGESKMRSSEVVILILVIILSLFCCLTCVGVFILIRNIPEIWNWLLETGLQVTHYLI